MILESLSVSRERFASATGWDMKPEGACLGEICVPVQDGLVNDNVNVEAVANKLGMPIVHDEQAGVWSLGTATFAGHALSTATAPELELPDWKGNTFQLSSLRGKKVVIVSWAPY
jgi:hypothetical protein